MSGIFKKENNNNIFKGDHVKFTGFEETSSETFKTPFLRILQTGSPECKKNNEKHIMGAEAGLFINTGTKQLYENLNIIVLKIVHNLIVWRPNRGGFVGVYSKKDEPKIVHKIEGVKKWDKDGNDIYDTISFYCMNAEDPMDIFIFPMSVSSLKHAKAFSTRIRSLRMNNEIIKVTWAGIWKISVVEESNDKGSWFTIGNTPNFIRFIEKEEMNNFVIPTIELLDKVNVDYSKMDSTSEDDSEQEF